MSNQPKHLVRFEVPHRGGDRGGGGGILSDFFCCFFFPKSQTKGENKNTPMVGRRAVKGRVHVRAGDVVGGPQKYILRDAERWSRVGDAAGLSATPETRRGRCLLRFPRTFDP